MARLTISTAAALCSSDNFLSISGGIGVWPRCRGPSASAVAMEQPAHTAAAQPAPTAVWRSSSNSCRGGPPPHRSGQHLRPVLHRSRRYPLPHRVAAVSLALHLRQILPRRQRQVLLPSSSSDGVLSPIGGDVGESLQSRQEAKPPQMRSVAGRMSSPSDAVGNKQEAGPTNSIRNELRFLFLRTAARPTNRLLRLFFSCGDKHQQVPPLRIPRDPVRGTKDGLVGPAQ